MIKLVDVSKYYRSNNNVALGLHKINLEFHVGEFVAITGESGSGKSTLLNVISGSDTYEDGELYFQGEETSYYDDADWENYRKEKISFIYQSYNLIDSFSVIDNVKTAIYIIHPDISEEFADKKAMRYLEKVGLEAQAPKRATQLSSGQKQRLAIARALAKETDIIVADEPTGNLDVENSKQIIELLNELSKEKLVLIVTHNYDEVEPYISRKIRMHDGEVSEDFVLRDAYEQTDDSKTEDKMLPLSEEEQRKKEKQDKLLLAKKMLQKVRTSRPHSQAVLILLFIFIFAAIFIFYGSFDKSIDFSIAKVYSDKTYANGDNTRISVKQADGSAITEEDIAQLAGLSHVKFVDKYDLVNDISYMLYREEDFTVSFRVNGGEKTKTPNKDTVVMLDGSKFFKTVSGLNAKDITEGTMAEGIREIVVCSDDKELVGKAIDVYFQQKNNWPHVACLELKITGLTDVGVMDQIYLSESLAQNLNLINTLPKDYKLYGIHVNNGYGLDYGTGYNEDGYVPESEMSMKRWSETLKPIFIIRPGLKDNQIVLSENYYSDAYLTTAENRATVYYQQTIHRTSYLFYGPVYARGLHLCEVMEDISRHGNSIIEVSQDLFDKIYPDQNSYQASVYVTDYAYLDRVINAIERKGYEAVSVYRAGTTDYDLAKVDEQTTLLAISLVALLVVFVIGILLIKLIMKTRDRDYRIMLLLGMNRSVLDAMNRLDITYNTIIAIVGTIVIANIAKILEIPYIASAVRYYEGKDYVIYMIVLAIMMMFLNKSVQRVKKKGRRDV